MKEGKPVTLRISIPGDTRSVSSDVLFSRLALLLRGRALSSGETTLTLTGDGSIYLSSGGILEIVHQPRTVSKAPYKRREKGYERA